MVMLWWFNGDSMVVYENLISKLWGLLKIDFSHFVCRPKIFLMLICVLILWFYGDFTVV